MPLEHIRRSTLLQNEPFQLHEFPSFRPGTLHSNHPAGHLLPRPVHRDHVMPMVVNMCAVIHAPSHPSRSSSWCS